MHAARIIGAAIAALIGLSEVSAQQITVTRDNGGSVKTGLGYGIRLNDKSSLNREWLTLHDSSMPADLEGTIGVSTKYESGRVAGRYIYEAAYAIKAREALSALEVRFLVFDVWGKHVRTLSATELIDIPAGATERLTGTWNLWSENEASLLFGSIAYIARVRTREGRVVNANGPATLAEIRKYARSFEAENLEPTRDPRK